MRLRNPRRLAMIGALAVALAGSTAALAPNALAASGGGCTKGSSGPAQTVYSCISAPGYAQVRGDAYVYMNSVPSGCTVTVTVWDWQFDYIVSEQTFGCAKSEYVAAPTYTNAYSELYYSEVTVDGGAPVWSPGEGEP